MTTLMNLLTVFWLLNAGWNSWRADYPRATYSMTWAVVLILLVTR